MSSHDRIIISWLELRRIIGFIGLFHPVVLFLGGLLIFHTQLQSSMSAYYYTGMRDVFVGLGFATAFFLLSYKGYDTHDRIVSAIAGFAALVVALFPTSPAQGATRAEVIIGYIHVSSAFVFLLALAWFCLVQFPKSKAKVLSIKKRTRNKIYRASGITILLCLGVVASYFLPTPLQKILEPYHPIFFAELISFWAFGIAWLVKGQAILADE